MVRLARMAAVGLVAMTFLACGAVSNEVAPTDPPSPLPSHPSDRPAGPGGGNPNASPPPFMCGDHLCPTPSPR